MPATMPDLEWTSEADDLRTIIVYLGLGQSSEEAQQITGLAKSAISEVLSGRRRRDTARRRHIAHRGRRGPSPGRGSAGGDRDGRPSR